MAERTAIKSLTTILMHMVCKDAKSRHMYNKQITSRIFCLGSSDANFVYNKQLHNVQIPLICKCIPVYVSYKAAQFDSWTRKIAHQKRGCPLTAPNAAFRW